ncbi:MAG: hypothetical protein HY897_02575 [Deltaproteobacteria bacterium]|nr:hypothetical protein [Deltaproteobacteria bacterium]
MKSSNANDLTNDMMALRWNPNDRVLRALAAKWPDRKKAARHFVKLRNSQFQRREKADRHAQRDGRYWTFQKAAEHARGMLEFANAGLGLIGRKKRTPWQAFILTMIENTLPTWKQMVQSRFEEGAREPLWRWSIAENFDAQKARLRNMVRYMRRRQAEEQHRNHNWGTKDADYNALVDETIAKIMPTWNLPDQGPPPTNQRERDADEILRDEKAEVKEWLKGLFERDGKPGYSDEALKIISIRTGRTSTVTAIRDVLTDERRARTKRVPRSPYVKRRKSRAP